MAFPFVISPITSPNSVLKSPNASQCMCFSLDPFLGLLSCCSSVPDNFALGRVIAGEYVSKIDCGSETGADNTGEASR